MQYGERRLPSEIWRERKALQQPWLSSASHPWGALQTPISHTTRSQRREASHSVRNECEVDRGVHAPLVGSPRLIRSDDGAAARPPGRVTPSGPATSSPRRPGTHVPGAYACTEEGARAGMIRSPDDVLALEARECQHSRVQHTSYGVAPSQPGRRTRVGVTA